MANKGAYTSDIAKQMLEDNGWKKNTTYTLISRLIVKGALERVEPKFFCKPLVQYDDVVKNEAMSIIDRLCNGSKKMFLAAFLDEDVSEEEIKELRDLADKLKQVLKLQEILKNSVKLHIMDAVNNSIVGIRGY